MSSGAVQLRIAGRYAILAPSESEEKQQGLDRGQQEQMENE